MSWPPTITTQRRSRPEPGTCPPPGRPASAGSTTTAGSRLLDLYQRGKDKQWDATKRIDWELAGQSAATSWRPATSSCPIYGSRQWEKLNQAERDELGHHLSSWLFSQFLHGEQGALTVAARIVETVPDMDSKFYGATQVMDEARHVETFAQFLQGEGRDGLTR